MNVWLAATLTVLFAFAGFLSGRFFSRLPKPYWLLGYFIPLIIILIYGIAIHFPIVSFNPPISWMMMGRKKFAIAGFIIAMVLTTPLSKLPLKRDRTVILILMTIMIFCMSVLPFITPAFNRNQLAHLKTRVDGNGICRQGTDFTCGPAAAVTALRKLGLPAEEGRLAILSFTSKLTGTPPDILAEVLQKNYRQDGLIVEYRAFKSVSELKPVCPVLAVIKFGFFVDHYVTVLQVTDSEVIVGDPLDGLDQMSYADFEKKWRFVGITLKRKS